MAAGSIEELLDLLYTEIEEAKNAPLSNDRCVVDRDRVLDMIDDVKAEMPVEIKRAKDIEAQRNDYMAAAKQKADRLRQEAEDYAKELLNKEASIGFKADLKDKYDNDENLLSKVTTEDVRKFGMIPEFLGRLPVMFTLEALTEDMLVRILKEPKNAIIRQYEKLLAMDEVKLVFDEDALHSIAKEAKEKKVGARALRSIIEDFMLDIMYEIPKDDNIGMVTITKDYVEKKGGPLITMRGCAAIEEKPAI